MSTAAPGGHSQASLSPANSQTRSTANDDDISLESLVAHLLASKRSLSSISTVWRANEIVTSTRSALVESVILDARTGFLKRGISHQLNIIQRVRSGMEDIYKERQQDFEVSAPIKLWGPY
jgi:autophagy-related protein 17